MTKNRSLVFLLLSALFVLGSIAIYIYFRSVMKQGIADLPSAINILVFVLIFIYIFVGIYHLFVLFQLLQKIPVQSGSTWVFSTVFILITLSGIILLTDVTLLSDIGKEYLVFDVSNEWNMLFGFTLFHLLTVILSYFIIVEDKTPKQSIFETIRTGSDQMYSSLYQIIAISGLIGAVMSSIFVSGLVNDTVLNDYLVSITIFLAGLIALPTILFVFFWYIKFHRKPLIHWMDEHEWLLSIKGMSYALVLGWIFMGLGVLLSILGISISLIIWFVLTVFLQFLILSGSVLLQTKK